MATGAGAPVHAQHDLVRLVEERARVRVDGITTTLIGEEGALSSGQWHHAAVTHDGSLLTLYLDGEMIADTDPTLPVAVGGQPPGTGGRNFDGLIDDVRIHPRALLPVEIAALASTPSTVLAVPVGCGRATLRCASRLRVRDNVRCLSPSHRILAGGVVLLLASCSSGDGDPLVLSPVTSTGEATDGPATGGDLEVSDNTAGAEAVADVALIDADIVVDAARTGIAIDPRLFGTNVPAWLGPGTLSDPGFLDTVEESGVTVARLPGGSWSNYYEWLHCETENLERCDSAHWAAKPTDFIDFLQASGLPGSWTVNINETAQSAAALVSFFNGEVGDDRPIGVDRQGVDWETVGTWAQLRSDAGNPDPIGIQLWEVGNEVYGGKPSTGGQECQEWGWEAVWTCDGTEYVVGTEDHDGYLAIRGAMLEVDPAIEVGAVGVTNPSGWNEFGNEVITLAGDDLDFYAVHTYGYESSPAPEEAVQMAAVLWPAVLEDVRDALPRDVPIALTEYNLVASESADTEQSMTRSMNALFIADSVGQLAALGVDMANHWNLANGVTGSGTDYGLVDVETFAPYPQFYAMALWNGTGSVLLDPVMDEGFHLYPTLHDDSSLTLVAVNNSEEPVSHTVGFTGMQPPTEAIVTGVSTNDLMATEMKVHDEQTLEIVDSVVALEFPGWSIVRIHVGDVG